MLYSKIRCASIAIARMYFHRNTITKIQKVAVNTLLIFISFLLEYFALTTKTDNSKNIILIFFNYLFTHSRKNV